MTLTVACVLRSGGIYDARWVRALKTGVERFLPQPHQFVCLSDIEIERVETIPLAWYWPGWWAKIELFTPGRLTGPVLYLDLDTLPVGDLSDVASYRGDLAVLSDFYHPELMASGVMAFTPGPHTDLVYHRFIAAAEATMARCRPRSDLFYRTVMENPHRLQDLFPGQIVSLKKHTLHDPPDAPARLVCGHGRPRFDTQEARWAHDEWRRRAA